MRRIVLLAITMMMAAGMQANMVSQEIAYHSMLKDGKLWRVLYHDVVNTGNGAEFPVYEISLVLRGDTLIDGLTYYKMYRESENGATLEGCFREEGKKMYRVLKGTIEPKLWMDFDVTVSSKEECYWQDGEFTCNEVDTIVVNGNYFRRFTFAQTDAQQEIQWVEGVGSLWSPLEPFGHLLNDGKKYELIACYEDGECIFTAEDFKTQAYQDDITDGIKEPTARLSAHPSAFYDLQGRRLTTQPRCGIYVKDGKKVVVK